MTDVAVGVPTTATDASAGQTTVETPISNALNPWEMDAGAVAKAAGNPAPPEPTKPDPVTQIPKGNFEPWDMFPEDLAKLTAQIPKPTQPTVTAPVVPTGGGANNLPVPKDFDGVFHNLVQTESNGMQFDKSGNILTSDKGAQGITQVLKTTGANPGFGVTPMQSQTKQEFLRFGKDYLQAMYQHYNNNASMAVAAYNAGPRAVDKLINDHGNQWQAYLLPETKQYIRKILGNATITSAEVQ